MKGKLFQFYTAFATSFGQLLMGLLNTWPSYTTSILSSNETTPLSEPLSSTEESLLSSLPSLGAMAGSAIVGILINKLGRKNGGVVLSLPLVICWSIITIATSTKLMLAARFLGGISGGSSLVYAPIFISEIAEDSFRGALASAPVVLYVSGTLFSYIIGWQLTYRTIIWVNLICSVAYTLMILSLKESPVYLLSQKEDEKARESIAHYRGTSPSSRVVMEEYSKLKQHLMPAVELISITGDPEKKPEEAEKEKLNTEIEPEEQKKMSAIKMLFTSPTSQRAFLIVASTISLQVMMGIVPVQVYAKRVFLETDPEQADLYTVIFALVLMCGSLVTTLVADKAGRRILLISSSLLVCVFMSSLGFLLQTRVAPPWVTVVIIQLCCFSFMAGAGSVPYVLLAEVFVNEVQNLASMLIIELVWFLNFFILALFPFMNKLMGIHGSFYCFAGFAIISAIVGYVIVPETKGLSSEQIQEKLLGKKKK